MRNYRAFYTADGYNRRYNVTFPYLRREHVHAYVNGYHVNFWWVNDGCIEIEYTPAANDLVRIQRETPLAPIHTIQNDRPTPAEHYNELTQQALYRTEEMETDDVVDKANDAANRSEAAAWKAEDAAWRAQNAIDQGIASAETAANFAQRWASDPEDGDLIYDGRNPAGNSSYHWAQKSYRQANLAQYYADKAQDFITEASAAHTGYPAGTFLDLGHVTDQFKLFDTDLGNI